MMMARYESSWDAGSTKTELEMGYFNLDRGGMLRRCVCKLHQNDIRMITGNDWGKCMGKSSDYITIDLSRVDTSYKCSTFTGYIRG